ncbi:hypothetical protein AB4147_08955 [Vibrio cyclitrophicus]
MYFEELLGAVRSINTEANFLYSVVYKISAMEKAGKDVTEFQHSFNKTLKNSDLLTLSTVETPIGEHSLESQVRFLLKGKFFEHLMAEIDATQDSAIKSRSSDNRAFREWLNTYKNGRLLHD